MLLEKINSPKELKGLRVEQLPELAQEIRKLIIDTVSCNGGHLASSLGAVELILALHYCLDAPKDKIIFDVGHQAYTHKIITGRRKTFSTLRQFGGISGFPTKEESEYDVFTSGHSSSAASLALGLAAARDLRDPEKKDSFRIVCVIGDGSLSGGLCFEGLNNIGHLKKDIMVVLNTNELSIAPNVGELSTYLNKIISLPIYNHFKNSLESFVKSRMPKGSRIIKLANKFEEGLKGLFVPGLFFEELGFRYFGPFDGHDSAALVKSFKNILNIKGPVLFHVVTKKGKGYLPAENEPVKFHGTAPFELETGICKKDKKDLKSYTQVFRDKIVSLAKADKKIVAITAAMPEGTGLDKFRDEYPERFFDVGIAEEHAVCFAAGLAREGYKPVVAIYSTFLQRAFDQIIEDVALQNLGVVFAVDRAGIVGEDGLTHQGIFDINYLNVIPNLTFLAPSGPEEFQEMLEFSLKIKGPVAIRYPRATAYPLDIPRLPIETGKAQSVLEGENFVIVALGSMLKPALESLEILKKDGFKGGLINARFIRPLDKNLFEQLRKNYKFIFSIEEGIVDGGFGSSLSDLLNSPVIKIGLERAFIPHGCREVLLGKYGLSSAAIAEKIKSVLWRR